MCPLDVNSNGWEDKTEKKTRRMNSLIIVFFFFNFSTRYALLSIVVASFKLLLRKMIFSSMKPQEIHPLKKSLSDISTIPFNDPSLTS